MKFRSFLLFAAVLVATPLFAREKTDVIVMKNGDRLTCEIKSLESGTLSIGLDYATGTISINWSKVDHLESKQLFIVKTQDGLVHSGTLSMPATSGGRPVKIEVVEAASKKVELDKTQVINVEETEQNFWHRFNGELGASSTISKANQSAQYNLNANVNYVRERWTGSANVSSSLTSNSGSPTSTRNETTLTAQRLLQRSNWFYLARADFLQSAEQGIQLQSTFSGGIGRYLKNNNHTQIALFGGLAWQTVNYQQSFLVATNQRVTSAMAGTNVNLFYFDKTNLSLQAVVLPAISEPGRVHANLNASYYIKVWGNLSWNVTLYANWDNRPPPGYSSNDYGSSAGLSWTFGNH